MYSVFNENVDVVSLKKYIYIFVKKFLHRSKILLRAQLIACSISNISDYCLHATRRAFFRPYFSNSMTFRIIKTLVFNRIN